MIEDWIDTLGKVFEVEDGRGGQVYAYRLFERDEFPDDIPLDRPVALTFLDNVDFEYSQGGPTLAFWHGSTELNLTPDLSRKRLPYVLRFFKRIMAAAAANMKLGGLVEYFILDESATISLEVLKYGNQAAHLGLVVKWTVKENISGQLTIGDASLL
jgi:hypothetical protein